MYLANLNQYRVTGMAVTFENCTSNMRHARVKVMRQK